MTFSSRAIEAAWKAYQDTPIDLLADSDEETKRCVVNALTAALAVDGVAIVPKEPTEAMIHAGHHQIDWCRNDQATHLPEHPSQTDNGVGTTCKQDICDAWSAMITAASDREERMSPPKEKP